jgi:two-component system LytT family sensor kinase
MRRPSPVIPAPAVLRFWPFQLAGWLAFGIAMGASRFTRNPWVYMATAKGALALLGLLVTLGLRVVYRRVLARDLPLPRLLVVLVVISYLAALPWTAAYNVFDAYLIEKITGRPPQYFSYTGGALYHAFVLVAWSVLYLGVRQYTELQQGRERLLQAQSLANSARLAALRYQLNPHFLFNTLNAISTLVVERRTADAARMISRLGDLLRLTLDEQGADEVPLSSELGLLRRYLDIEQIRFGDRLAVSVDVPRRLEDALVPPLILQPLVENAVRHGIATRERGGMVAIVAEQVDGRLRITVDDDGPGLPLDVATSSDASNGVGLANTAARLRAHYGDNQRLVVGQSSAGGARILLEFPLNLPASEGAPLAGAAE